MTIEAITVGQAAKLVGVRVDALRELCEAGDVTAERSPRGHWYLEPDDVPSRQRVGELLRRDYRRSVADAQSVMARFMRELEAIQLDLNEAKEDASGRGRLGNDLRSVWSWDGAFERALSALRGRLLTVDLAHRRLKDFYGLEDGGE